MENAGRDATLAFRGSRHSKDAFDMLEKFCIGILVEVSLSNSSHNKSTLLTKTFFFIFTERKTIHSF
jgi:cytochrome b involved in lipid metabolism